MNIKIDEIPTFKSDVEVVTKETPVSDEVMNKYFKTFIENDCYVRNRTNIIQDTEPVQEEYIWLKPAKTFILDELDKLDKIEVSTSVVTEDGYFLKSSDGYNIKAKDV